MSNTWGSGLMPNIIANSREYLRRQTSFLPLFTHDFSDASGKVGQTVNIPVPKDIAANTLVADRLPPAAADLTFTTATLTLDQGRASAPFAIEQVHLQNYAVSGPNSVLQQQINSAIDTVVGLIAQDVWSKYYMIPTFVGTAGNYFFNPTAANSTHTINGLADAKQALFQQRVPPASPVYGVFGYKDFADLRKVTEVRQAYSIGTPEVIQNSQFPSIMGIGMKEDYFAPTHTAGTITYGVVNANVAAGNSEIVLAGNAAAGCALKRGDIISFYGASGTQSYSLIANATIGATTGTLYLDRPLDEAAVAGNTIAVATNFGTSRFGLIGDMTGVGLVTRIPENPMEVPEMPVPLMGSHYPITDPVSGVTVLLSFYGQYMQRSMIVSCIWGSQIVDPRRLVRCLSYTS
jgi:hypothetical protein